MLLLSTQVVSMGGLVKYFQYKKVINDNDYVTVGVPVNQNILSEEGAVWFPWQTLREC